MCFGSVGFVLLFYVVVGKGVVDFGVDGFCCGDVVCCVVFVVGLVFC